jgi:leucyl-tRNA synthetase
VQKHAEGGAVTELQPDSLDTAQKDLRRKTHQTIAKIGDDIGRRYTFNTAIAASMELLNSINRFEDDSDAGRAVVRESLEAVVLMLSPMVPHICHELWASLGHQTALIDVPWPTADEAALERDLVEVVVQVNGKLRGRISVAVDADNEVVGEQALADHNVQRFVADKEVRKIIVVPGRLVNIVV